MSCKCARSTDKYHGWECTITGGECMFLIPNSKVCAEEFGEGPDADHIEQKKTENGTTVTGASDDLIEIEGELYEEFNCFSCKNGVMAFSDGTLLNVEYDEDGIWRFKVRVKGSLYESKEEGNVDEDINDKVHFNSGLKWCVFSDEMQSEVKR